MSESGERPSRDVEALESHLAQAAQLVRSLSAIHDLGKTAPPSHSEPTAASPSARPARGPRSLGRARKVSVSMPEELTEAVRQRVSPGDFSQYVTEAVARQLELDLLYELSQLLEAEYGPVPDELLAEASAAWPDDE